MTERITQKKIKTIGMIGLLSANLLSYPLNNYALAETVSSEQTATKDVTSSQTFQFKDENGTVQANATVTYPNRVKVGTTATVKIHVDWTTEAPDDVVCVFQGADLQLSGAVYTKLTGVSKVKYALTDTRAAFIYDGGAVSGGKDITLQVQPSEAGEITINGGLNYSQLDPKVSSNVQPLTISMSAYKEDKDSVTVKDSLGNPTKHSSQNIGKNSKKLPNTGEQNIVITSILGLGLFISALGGLSFKKIKSSRK